MNVYGELQEMQVSVCTYENGDFEVYFVDKKTGEEVVFNGVQKLNDKEFEIITRLAPACVWTTYKEVSK